MSIKLKLACAVFLATLGVHAEEKAQDNRAFMIEMASANCADATNKADQINTELNLKMASLKSKKFVAGSESTHLKISEFRKKWEKSVSKAKSDKELLPLKKTFFTEISNYMMDAHQEKFVKCSEIVLSMFREGADCQEKFKGNDQKVLLKSCLEKTKAKLSTLPDIFI